MDSREAIELAAGLLIFSAATLSAWSLRNSARRAIRFIKEQMQ